MRDSWSFAYPAHDFLLRRAGKNHCCSAKVSTPAKQTKINQPVTGINNPQKGMRIAVVAGLDLVSQDAKGRRYV